MNPPRILVTAAASKTGLPIALELLERDFPVAALVRREDARSVMLREHGADVPTAHLRPTFFAEWLLYYAAMVKVGAIYGPSGDGPEAKGRQALVAAGDQGRVIAGILRNPAPYVGQTLPLYGPLEQTWTEVAESLSQVLGRTVRYQQVPFEAFQAGFEQEVRAERGDADYSFLFQHLREVALDQQNGLFAGTNSLVERITGRRPMTVETFVEKHREAFA